MAVIATMSQQQLSQELHSAATTLHRLREQAAPWPTIRYAERHVSALRAQSVGAGSRLSSPLRARG